MFHARPCILNRTSHRRQLEVLVLACPCALYIDSRTQLERLSHVPHICYQFACFSLLLLSEWLVDHVATNYVPFTSCCLADSRVADARRQRAAEDYFADAAPAPAAAPAAVMADVAAGQRCATATKEAMLVELRRAEAAPFLAHQVSESFQRL